MRKKLISIQEAANILGVHRQTISNYIKRGILMTSSTSGTQPGKQLLVFQQDVFKILKSKKYNLKDLYDRIALLKSELEVISRDYDEKIKNYREGLVSLEEYKRVTNFLSLDKHNVVSFWFSNENKLNNERNINIIKEYLEGKSYGELSKKYLISSERIRQIIYRYFRVLKGRIHKIPKLVDDLKESTKRIIILEKENEDLKNINSELKKYFLLNSNDKRFSPKDDYSPHGILLSDCELSVRALNCLNSADIKTLGDLLKYSKNDLLKFRNFGKRSLNELEEFLQIQGYEWKNGSVPTLIIKG